MIEIVGVKFNSGSKIYYFDPQGINIEAGTMVLVETSRSVEMGKVVTANSMVSEESVVPPLKPVIRIATEEDLKQAEENKQKEKEAFDLAVEKIAEHKLDMKLVGAEYTFDRSKILFYFTADGRVDFRELVKSLASLFRTRIELRQIGVRDEARQLGSIGICGRFLCCSTFLNDFHSVSIKMAKEQGLSLNPTKISGVCGRLMCCLQYEQDAYEDMLSRMPMRGDKVETPDGVGIVADTATLKGRIKVKFIDDNGDTVKYGEYVLGEFNPVGKGTVRLENPPKSETSETTENEEISTVTSEEILLAEDEAPVEPKEKKKEFNHQQRRGKGNRKNNSGGQEQQKNNDKAEEKSPEEKKNKNFRNNRNNRGKKRPHRPDKKPAENKIAESTPGAGPAKGGYGNGYQV